MNYHNQFIETHISEIRNDVNKLKGEILYVTHYQNKFIREIEIEDRALDFTAWGIIVCFVLFVIASVNYLI